MVGPTLPLLARASTSDGTLEVHADAASREALEACGATRARRAEDLVDGDAGRYRGRGRPVVVPWLAGGRVVVKTLRHGGAMGRWLGDRYLGATRLWRTVSLSEHLRRHGVPTPPVVFVRIHRHKWFGCRLELATQEVANSVDLDRWCSAERERRAARRQVAEALGRTLSVLHASDFEHTDLNAKNLLVATSPTSTQISVIDLEGSRLGALSDRVKARNLARLWRSLTKLGHDAQVSRSDRARVLRTYGGSQWKRWWRAVARAQARSGWRHRLAWWWSSATRRD